MIKLMNCKHCGKEFIAITPNQKYCSKTCRFTVYALKAEEKKKNKNYRHNPKTGQLCWRCQRACGGCSWSKKLKPIKGWIAKKVKRKDVPGTTYKISSCPLFLEDVD